ncbi:MAG: orotidine 5-phosphate decarboxylase [Candidatus Saccharibacteria bacterium]|nr:orotidine 5-phosphate decarboxylase [Candidatus Saccharibacteria bacterium]
MSNASKTVIWSADVEEETLFKVLASDSPLQYVKLDRLYLTGHGLVAIAAVQELGFKVFADAKIAEVPTKVVELAKLHLRYRPWMLNVMATICSTGLMAPEDKKKTDGLKRFADLCRDADTRSCAVTVLTSKSPGLVGREFNRRTPVDQVLTYCELLLAAGFTDVVCSAQEASAIRSEPRFDGLELNTPGIRLPGSDARDQQRITTPAAAIAAGATRLVIGSDLTNGDFTENFRRVAANLDNKE